MSSQLEEQIANQSLLCRELRDEIGRVLVGQEKMVSSLLVGLLTGGHVLLEGMPGLAKTLAVQSLAKAIDTDFSRIQFTPDMLPADVIGTEIFNPKEGTYSVKQGPVFSNLVLADEINRAPAKVQAALLESMQERQVTIGGQSFQFQEPFLVLATQNPIEQEGTYPLPEAQIDRFMMKILIDYPSREEEQKVVARMAGGQAMPEIKKVASPQQILQARETIEKIWVDDKVRDYVVDLVRATRNPEDYQIPNLDSLIESGASPRASIFLIKAAKAHAFLQGRGYVTPHDCKSIALEVIRHRMILTFEAEAEGKSADDLVNRILENVPVP
ncbi:MAG: MoxR family ATPase [Planctomycetota bacterium]|jgi:MoxR-like ATPase|nr:MoxR family ATPase [Planctomycetota bacterium]